MKVDTRSAAFGTFVLTLSGLATQGIGFAYRIGLTRFLGPEGMGLYSLVMPAYSVLMSVMASGLTVAVSRLSASYGALGRTLAIRQLLRRTCAVFFVLFAIVALPTALFSDFISVQLLGDARTRMGLLVLLPCMLLTGVENIHKNHFYGRKQVIPPAVTEVLEMSVRMLAVLGLLTIVRPQYEELSVALIIAGMVVCEIVSSVTLTIWSRRQKEKPQGEAVALRPMLKSIHTIAVPIALANLLGNLISSANAVIIPARLIAAGMTSSEALSAYGVMIGMTLPMLSLPTSVMGALSLVMIPRMAENLALKNYAHMRIRVVKTLRITALLMMPAMLALALWGKPLAQVIFHQSSAGAHMPLLALATFFACFEGIAGSLLSGMGLQNRNMSNHMVSGIVQLVITWLATGQPHIRMAGFVWAYLIASLLGAILCVYDIWCFLWKQHGGKTYKYQKS